MHESVQSIALEFIKNKNNKTFTKILTRLKPGLTSHIYKYVKDNDLCNEIISQTFVSVWEKIDQYKPEYNFSTWVYAIAKNEALGQLRIQKRNISHEKLSENHSKLLKSYTPLVMMETEVIGPAGEQITQDLYDASIAAIGQLKEPYKTVMIEREIKQKRLKTIAKDLGWEESTVKTRLRKARKDVAENIGQKYPELLEAYMEEEFD